MADYNIYIHAIGTGGATNENPTVPWSARESGGAFSQTQSKSSGDIGGGGINAAQAIIKATSFARNPDSAISSAFSSIAKAFPIVAAAYACVKLGEAIVDNCIDFDVIETGNYRTQTEWQNFKSSIKNVFHPISSSIQSYKQTREWNRENYKAKAQRDLLGDSVINSYTGRGV